MSLNLVPPVCKGACCRNPYGVCAHKRGCTYHAAERNTVVPPVAVTAAEYDAQQAAEHAAQRAARKAAKKENTK